ncbi:hypothetical protein FB45DRAFT_531403 [Roridomyces roridus]|uniref:Uncharacterized protein n=1 Tax=Roridomyces roridus TaxID=1738132 RepID=A0AAD7BT13_9AGAR|nr:hypothetical protein FB45DRAFT_531403 [Roridomyces roridus]
MSSNIIFTTLPLVAFIGGPIDNRFSPPPRPKRAHFELEDDGQVDGRCKRLRPSAAPLRSRVPNNSFLTSYRRREAHKRHHPPPPPTGPVTITIFQTVAVIRRGESETPAQRLERLAWNAFCEQIGGESPHSPFSHSVALLAERLEQMSLKDVDAEMAEVDPDIEMEEAEPVPPSPAPVIRRPRRVALACNSIPSNSASLRMPPIAH